MKINGMQFSRWMGLSLLLLALGATESRAVSAKSALTIGDSIQQPSKAASAREVPVVDPETKADLLTVHHRYLEAIAEYQAITPQTAHILNKIGVAYEHMFMDADAKDYFERAIRMNRQFASAYNNLGTIYYHVKDYKRAERYYKKSLKMDAQDASVYGNLGTLYIARKKFHDGTEAYQRAFMLNPGIFQEIAENGIEESATLEDLASMNYCFAKIFAQAGMNDLAVAYLEKAISDGFHDRTKLEQDQEFAGLRGTPEFQHLMNNEGR
jgi:tetratricopeptide (TPR) repeat protein